MHRKDQAKYILHNSGLLRELQKYGAVHVIGSYKMDLMAWNDLDIYVENDAMCRKKLYQLTSYILGRFMPVWYEAKEEKNELGALAWFHGFEFYLEDVLWNVDIWFFDNPTIQKAEKYCATVSEKVQKDQTLRTAILNIKQDLIGRHLYPSAPYTSMDVYDAVLNQGVRNTEEFLTVYAAGRKGL